MGMTDRDKKLMIVVMTVVLLGGFWLLVLGPKRAAVSTAQEERDTAAKALSDAKAATANGQAEKKTYRVSYAQLVRLGKAVPAELDEGTLVVQVADMADASSVDFTALTVATGGTSTSLPGATGANGATAPTTCDSGSSTASGPTGATGASSAVGETVNQARDGAAAGSADANRAAGSNADQNSCANAPTPTDLAAASSGLQLDNFTLTFRGSFFRLHTFFERMNDLVEKRNRSGKVKVTGRLFQISQIDLRVEGFPNLEAKVNMTGYRLPADVSATAGASPGGPAPATTAPASSGAAPASDGGAG